MENNIPLYLHFAKIEKTNSWETRFINALGLILRQILGSQPIFYCNGDVPGTVYCNAPESLEFINSNAYLFIFNTPANTELNESELVSVNTVIDHLTKQKNNNICIVNRYFKKKSTLADKFSKYITFNFFEFNPKTHEVIDFKPNSKEEKDNNYWLKITDLAYTIKRYLTFEKPETIESAREKTIFLAEVSLDQTKTRERLRRDLQLSGYNVIPDKPLSKDAGEFAKEVKTLLEQSTLSVNIMGELYGESPVGSDYSYQELQNRYFTEVYNNQQKLSLPNLIRRIIWAPPLLEPYEEKQIQYLKRINREINVTDNTELVQSTLADLVVLAEQKIKSIANSSLPTEEKKDTILLIADNYDDNSFSLICKEFEQRQIPYDIINTISKGGNKDLNELMERIGKYKNNLILNTKSENYWITSMLSILSRAKGYSQDQTEGRTGVFFLSDQKKYPDFFPLTIEPYVINNVNLSHQLEVFISKIKV